MQTRIALVGGSGFVGRALVKCLATAPDVSLRVIDLHPPAGVEVDFVCLDIVQGDWSGLLDGFDVMVHLAAQVNPPRPDERERYRRVHEDGAHRAIEAAEKAGLRKLVLCSSAVVYGAAASSPFPFTEAHPVRPNPDFPYALGKARQEQIFLAKSGDMDVVIARPAIVYGASARNYLTEMLRFAPGILPAIDGCCPPLQFVHVEDVARALSQLTLGPATGIFNVCPQDWLSFQQVAQIAKLRVVRLRKRWLAPLLDATYPWLPPWARAPSYILPYLQYAFVLSGRKLEAELGFQPRYSSEDALRGMLRGRRHSA